ncbi:MAG: Asd/ArgC dimerization domain-containing protein, partial [Candidatus Aenigmarchaeota archaeon]|nr:Asd/ArgC dimerization domain-containing protein [Candidatus Aenigmarchaeota archaeon]MDI6721952.1 Asd/ArgC dimerization domain-containing protein [Candidatus Aenigmarchaeota archaeon]
MKKKKVSILGAAGAAGQEFIEALQHHEWFEIHRLFGKSTKGKRLGECPLYINADGWVKDIVIEDIENIIYDADLICSALPKEEARFYEGEYAKWRPVFSTVAAYRYEKDVPIIILEANADHYGLLLQQRNRGWGGFISPGSNCTVVGPVISLKPIRDAYGLKRIFLASYQSISGAGRDAIEEWERQKSSNEEPLYIRGKPWFRDNVIPYIKDEEEKVIRETTKIMGSLSDEGIVEPDIRIECKCYRVPTRYGHEIVVFAETEEKITKEDAEEAYNRFNDECYEKFGSLPSSPQRTVVLHNDIYRPQPVFDADSHGGMATHVGRLEESRGFDNGISYTVLSHNLKKGAAKGVVQTAEYV